VKGWAPDGTEVELLPWQEEAVRVLLNRAYGQVLLQHGRRNGWSVVRETVQRLAREQAREP